MIPHRPLGCPRLGPSPSQTLDGLGPVRFLPRQLGVGSPKGLPPEYNEKQLTALDPDRVFNAILNSSHRRRRKLGYNGAEEITIISARDLWKKSWGKRWPPPPLRPCLKSKALWHSKDTWTVGGYNTSGSETRGQLVKTALTVWRRLW
ncbi:hypothetical protein PanWU01x14_209780 [Parasponia andersonii]|uniref:Uncharacterized protein n=1 Tax=Parasponia andersonii TaxID=3476 RepID=A0A2P5BUD6_PARAD|nr:hypothetical protein PanWU01x14_209780 [Parasponia andersonii]